MKGKHFLKDLILPALLLSVLAVVSVAASLIESLRSKITLSSHSPLSLADGARCHLEDGVGVRKENQKKSLFVSCSGFLE